MVEIDLTAQRIIMYRDSSHRVAGINTTNTFSSPQKYDDYLDVREISEPTTPASGYTRVWYDSATDKFKVKHTDDRKMVLE